MAHANSIKKRWLFSRSRRMCIRQACQSSSLFLAIPMFFLPQVRSPGARILMNIPNPIFAFELETKEITFGQLPVMDFAGL